MYDASTKRVSYSLSFQAKPPAKTPASPHPQQYRQALARANNILEGRSAERHRPCHETSGRLHRQAEGPAAFALSSGDSTKQVQSASAIDSPPHITSPSNIPYADAGGYQTAL